MTLQEASKELGRKLCGKVPHVSGTSEIFDSVSRTWKMYVDIDSANMQEVHAVIHGILKEVGGSSFDGHEIHLRRSSSKFGGTEEAL